jgi:hypothetical protein
MAVKVRLNEARLRRVAGVNLRPGLQSIEDADWKKVKAHKSGEALMEKGLLEEVGKKGPGRPSADDLVAEIGETFDMERLRELADDSRKKVSSAANEQIQKIEAQAG